MNSIGNAFRRLAALVVTGSALLTASAAGSDAVVVPVDSAATAVAAVLAGYLAPMQQSGAITDANRSEYLQGLATGMEVGPRDPGLTGMIEGAEVRSRINTLADMGLTVDREAVLAALTAIFSGQPAAMTAEEGNTYISRLLGVNSGGARLDPVEQAEFVASAASQPGAVTTPLGCVLVTVEEGNGDAPGPTDVVSLRYKGTLSDGTEFDSTGNESIELPVDGVVPGMSEGLRMMRPGGTYRLYIPSAQAYGADGIGGVIPGNAALVFDIKVNSIRPRD